MRGEDDAVTFAIIGKWLSQGIVASSKSLSISSRVTSAHDAVHVSVLYVRGDV